MARIITGLKPTGEITLGNYIGAIKQMIEYQDKYDSFIFVADLHALTIYQDPILLRKRIKSFIAMYIACGIDPNKNTIYIQSENPYIPAISYLLECHTNFGDAQRMIQFKEKSRQNANFSVGLLTYPILMASDILYCDANFVPVGIDQKQHVELARNIAIKFNNRYDSTFTVPDVLIKENGTKIKDLKDPTKKMSKSEENPQGVISLFDDLGDIENKIKKATTDSDNKVFFDEENKPGISNLMNILSVIDNISIKDIEIMFQDKGYKEFKEYVASKVCEHIKEIQKKYKEIINSDTLDAILDKGRDLSIALAKDKYQKMCTKIGTIR